MAKDGMNLMQKFEMHIHTANASPCAFVPACEIPKYYLSAGYNSIVITNHYTEYLFKTAYEGTLRQKVDKYVSYFRQAKKTGDDVGINVLFGMELNPTRYNVVEKHPASEFLIYGIDEQFLVENAELFLLSQEELFELCESNGFVMFQAHPFRARSFCRDFRYMHGVEVYNGNLRHNSFDKIAKTFAQEHNLLEIVGSDYHQIGDENIAHMMFEDDVKNEKQLANALKMKKYVLGV